MKELDTYLDLCTQVYDLSKPEVPEDDYGFYQSYAKEAKGLILEPMCGSGRFLLPLLKEGFEVHGFDASGHMLNALKEKALSTKLAATVWQGYTQNLSREERYSLIFIPSGSFCLITDQDEILATLKVFYEHLIDDGIFVFEAETKHSVPPLEVWRGSKWEKADGNMILLSSCAFMDNDICSSICKYELIDSGSVIKTEIEEYNIKIYDPARLLEMLKQVGFKQVKTVKAFDRQTSSSENDESVVYECRK